jgi:DNA-binding transcriptional LysR family regulator
MRGTESFDPATSKRRFVMVSPDYAAFSFLPRAQALVAREGPSTTFVIREPWPGMVDALRDGTLDLIAGAELPPAAGLIRTKLFQDELVCVVRRDHPQVAQSFDLKTFAALPHLLVTRDLEGTGPIDVALAAHGLQRHIAMRVPYHLAAPFIVARSDLIMMTTLALAKDAASMLPLRILRCPLSLPVLKVTMAWHERNQNDPANKWLRDITIRCASGVHDGRFPDEEPDPGAPGAARARKRSARAASPRKSRWAKRA